MLDIDALEVPCGFAIGLLRIDEMGVRLSCYFPGSQQNSLELC